MAETVEEIDPAITARRQTVAATLAKAPAGALRAVWDQFADKPAYSLLRPAETGLIMARGRIGGSGNPFNLGEMTVTRCSVRLESREVGHGYALGRDETKATIMAIADALAQRDDDGGLHVDVIAPLQRARADHLAKFNAETAATKVDFFTMVRGEDE